MKITVLGGSGFLGSDLSDLLSKEGYKVTIFDTKISKHKKKFCQLNWITLNNKTFIILIWETDLV